MGIYEKVPYVVGKGSSVLQCGRLSDKTVNVRPNLPGNVIVIHGVNDVGTTYYHVEKGLCEGLKARLGWQYVPGTYRLPGPQDKGVLQDDPDAVFFKRQFDGNTFSPVIPFYWGFREEFEKASTFRGQNVDRHGNRLDKDLSKEGGMFANATSTLPDMWGAGKSKFYGALDWAQHDATHPVLDNAGRMYMILAAKRLAALIAIIRDYDENEAVTLVAHSQGCMLSLLAQAFLLDDGHRPADTLILNNPPYSLVDKVPPTTGMVEGDADEDAKRQDARMRGQYGSLNGPQTLHARLQTLVNIVHGVVGKKHATPAFTALGDQCAHRGMVSGLWQASKDRDNRGKVYLYFCPEDMTVSLNNVQGIGWQGVPDFQHGKKTKEVEEKKRDPETRQMYKTGRMVRVLDDVVRQPLKELMALNANGAGFYQRVFSNKRRPDPRSGTPVLVGQAKPHDFVLRVKDEDDQAHTATSVGFANNHVVRAHLSEPVTSMFGTVSPEEARLHIRTINGEPLPVAVPASLCENAQTDADGRVGASEQLDQIDAAVAVTSDYGLTKEGIWEIHPDPTGHASAAGRSEVKYSPKLQVYDGFVVNAAHKIGKVKASLNHGKPEAQHAEILGVLDCVGTSASVVKNTGKVLVHRTETGDEARLRWQQASGARSFHGAIFGGVANHRQVTAYDMAIGGGTAASDPKFYAYLCAVADWRLKRDEPRTRPLIMKWNDFLEKFEVYWKKEPPWRRELIEGNAEYYSSGILPACVPTLMEGLPSSVVCETLECSSFQRPPPKPGAAPGGAAKVGKTNKGGA
jgi:pimeloyl-ACP methyl ester carboxylesterase